MPHSSLLEPRPTGVAEPVPRSPQGLRRRVQHSTVFLFVILAAQLMVVLDTTIVNVALPHIQSGLRFSSSGLSWVLNAYILTFGGLLLLGARAGDLLGRRRVFLTGIAIFSISSLLGGLALRSWMLLAARALQGIGAALAAPSALSLLTSVFPEGPKRVRAIALYTTVSAAGGAVGLVAGGLLTELVSWRWVMFVNVPIGIAIFFLGREVIGETESRHGRFDLVGAVTSTLGMTSVVFALVKAGTSGWSSAITVASFAIGFLMLGTFVRIERHVEEPILPLRLLSNPTRNTANLSRGLVYAGMYGMFFFLSQFLQDVQGYSPLRAGLAFLPIPAAVFIASQLTSRVLVGWLPQKVLMMIGAGLAMVSLLLATQLGLNASYAQVVVLLVLLGLGSGISFVSLTSASLTAVPEEDAGAASGLINVSQQLGAALGLAVLVTIFGVLTHHQQLGTKVRDVVHVHRLLANGLDEVLGVAALFALAAVVLISTFIRGNRPNEAPAPVEELDEDAESWFDSRLTAEAG